jgi:predicted Zn-dependent protease
MTIPGWDDEVVSDELHLARLRNWRDSELIKTDFSQLPDSPVDKLVWAEYRQLLRDLPKQNKNPQLIVIPIRPA